MVADLCNHNTLLGEILHEVQGLMEKLYLYSPVVVVEEEEEEEEVGIVLDHSNPYIMHIATVYGLSSLKTIHNEIIYVYQGEECMKNDLSFFSSSSFSWCIPQLHIRKKLKLVCVQRFLTLVIHVIWKCNPWCVHNMHAIIRRRKNWPIHIVYSSILQGLWFK